jgi:polar amino acid transport system substrate-binding protein
MRIFTLLLLLVLSATAAFAQSPKELRVSTREVAPFVIKEPNGHYSGFSIELWEAIAIQLGVKSKYSSQPNVKALLEEIHQHKADLGVAAISITAERDKQFDFSQPIYDSGLQILVNGDGGEPSLWSGFVEVMTSPVLRQFLVLAAIFIILPTHLLWFLERRHDEGIIRHKSYFPGIFEAAWWSVSCLATQAEEMPKAVLARVLAVLWMFFAVIFIAFVTAALTANLTLQQLRGDIHGPEDLPGKRVATVSASTSAGYLKEQHIVAREFPTIDQAFEALDKKDVEAVVYDSPILLYYSAHKGKGRVQVVGPVFRHEAYGIAFPQNSPWREPVNVALLTLKENGTYDEIHNRWFGQDDQ